MLKYFIEFFTIKQVYRTILTVFVILFLYYSLTSLLDHIIVKGKNDLEIKKRKTILNFFENILRYLFFIIMLIVILSIFGVDTKSFIAGLGIAGVVVGLALQDALKDIISGISIMMDDYFVVGDKVEIKGFKGTVISLGLKATKIQNKSGAINILSNRNIDNVINYSKKSPYLYLYATFNNVNKQEIIENHLQKIVEEIKTDKRVKKESHYVGIDEIIDNKVKYLIKIKCDRNTEEDIKSLFNAKLKELYDNKKIEK